MSLRRAFLPKKGTNSCPDDGGVGDVDAGDRAVVEEDRWSRMLPELLGEIIKRVEASEDRWPVRKSVVSCACVCKRWREITMGIVRSPLETGKITFPSSLKQPGPRDFPIQCFIKRNKKNSTYYLYLGLTQTFMDKGKFLLAARRIRHGAHTEYILSLDADDLSQGSNAYVGKLRGERRRCCRKLLLDTTLKVTNGRLHMLKGLQEAIAASYNLKFGVLIATWGHSVMYFRSDFLGTKFTIYDSRPPYNGAKASSSRASRRFASKQISPQVSAGNFEIGQVSYKFNLLKSRGPRRMHCTLQCPPTQEATMEETFKSKTMYSPGESSVVLRNKAPRWHEHLQCWCLNFHGRVTVASVKNFQLAAMADPSQPGADEAVLLQFGKVADDMFTMDYRQPLSAFQAFAICLTSFGTKFACE